MISRRRFLLVAAALSVPGLTGCESGPTPPVPPTQLPSPTSPSPDAPSPDAPSPDLSGSPSGEPSSAAPGDAVVRSAAAQSELDLLAAYAAAVAAHPKLVAQLAPFQAAHREHLVAMTGDPAPDLGSPLPLDRGVKATRRWLAGLELAAAEDRSGQAGAAQDPELVTTLALIAASESQHHHELEQPGSGTA